MAKTKITTIDFTEHDTIAALQYMISLCEKNEVAGMVFALALKHKRDHPHLCGATGRLASDTVEAAGIASMLNLKMTQDALHASMMDK